MSTLPTPPVEASGREADVEVGLNPLDNALLVHDCGRATWHGYKRSILSTAPGEPAQRGLFA